MNQCAGTCASPRPNAASGNRPICAAASPPPASRSAPGRCPAVGRDTDHDPARGPRRDLRRARLQPIRAVDLRARQDRRAPTREDQSRRRADAVDTATRPQPHQTTRVTQPALCEHCGLQPVGYLGRDGCWDCLPRQRTQRQICTHCAVNPVAYFGRDSCYDCVPRQRRAALICKRCGSSDHYASGLCHRCHRNAALIDSCHDCHAWGTLRRNKWLCEACRGWRRRYTNTGCSSCGRTIVVNERGCCRLCTRQATILNRPHPTTAHSTSQPQPQRSATLPRRPDPQEASTTHRRRRDGHGPPRVAKALPDRCRPARVVRLA